MRKLNRKGFTLIELLAVIVIMAIIVVVTVPTIINSISDARVSSIWNLAKSTANSYDTLSAQSLLSGKDFPEATTNWSCITTEQANLFELSVNDVVLSTKTDMSQVDGFTVGEDGDVSFEPKNLSLDSISTSCSAIRLKSNGSAEVLLIAQNDGKFDVSGKVVYAYSENPAGTQQ